MEHGQSAPWGVGFARTGGARKSEPAGAAGIAAIVVLIGAIVSAWALVALDAGGAL